MTTLGTDVVTLTSGEARCAIVPRVGGAVAGFWWERAGGRVDWLRPAAPAAIAAGDATQMGCFPLVPYANRLRRGRFLFRGREVIEATEDEENAARHGHGWRRQWAVSERGEDRLALEYVHRPSSWPWEYCARQSFVLTPDALTLTLTLENRSGELMPAGLGFRTCLPRRAEAVVTAATAGVWLADDERLPTRRAAVPPQWDLARGRALADLALDHIFTGWSGGATVAWPERRVRLALEAGQPLLSFLAVETAADEAFRLAPVSHCADAINLAREGADGTGLRILAPGACRSAGIVLRPALEQG